MLQCLAAKSPTSSLPDSPPDSHIPPSEGPSADGTPRLSPIDLPHQYGVSLYTKSFNEVWSQTRVVRSDSHDQGLSMEEARERILSRVLEPNQETVQVAIGQARPGKLTRLVSAYVDETSNTVEIFLHLQRAVDQARDSCIPLLDLLSGLPVDPGILSESECSRACEIFAQFDAQDDLFPCFSPDGFMQMGSRFSELKRYLDVRIKKSRSRALLIKRVSSGPALCLIGTATVAAVSAAVVTAHTLLAFLVAIPCATNHMTTPRKFAKRVLTRAAQLDAASKSTSGLDGHFESIHRLVDKVQGRFENARKLSRMGLSGDPFLIAQVVKHLKGELGDPMELLEELEKHICLCLTAVNKVRRQLLEQIGFRDSVNNGNAS